MAKFVEIEVRVYDTTKTYSEDKIIWLNFDSIVAIEQCIIKKELFYVLLCVGGNVYYVVEDVFKKIIGK